MQGEPSNLEVLLRAWPMLRIPWQKNLIRIQFQHSDTFLRQETSSLQQPPWLPWFQEVLIWLETNVSRWMPEPRQWRSSFFVIPVFLLHFVVRSHKSKCGHLFRRGIEKHVANTLPVVYRILTSAFQECQHVNWWTQIQNISNRMRLSWEWDNTERERERSFG